MNMQARERDLQSGERFEPFAQRGEQSLPGRALARAAIAHARCALDRSMRPEECAERAWPFDTDVPLILRAATTPTTMANATALVHVVTAILPALAPQSAAAALFDVALKLQFGPEANAFKIPGVIPPNGAFVGEALPKPVGQGLSSTQQMNPNKIAAIAVASAELLAQAAPEALIQQMLAEAAGPALDAAVFGSGAGSANVPAGLLNGVSATTPAAAGPVYDAILADLGALGGAVSGVAGNGEIVFVMNPAQAITAKLAVQPDAGYRIFGTNAVAPGTVIAVATNALASAVGVPAFETSTQATLQMDDAASGSLMAAGPVSSMFQTSSVALKMIMPATWARRAPGGVAYMTNVNW
jgi:HK97 family phage major capsid protein